MSLRMFYLGSSTCFFKKLPFGVFFFGFWKAELNIKSLGNFGINCQYLRKSQFLLPSCLPTSSTSPVFEVKRFITTGRQGILVMVEVRLLLLVTTSYQVATRCCQEMMEKFQLTVFPGAPTEVCVLMCLDFFVFGNQPFLW